MDRSAGRIEGKVAIITGAGSIRGLGYAAALRLAQEGAAVVLSDIDAESVKAAAEGLTQSGYRAIGLAQDVTSEERWGEIVAETEKAFGRVDILVNNAGIVIPKALSDLPAKDFRRVVDINLTGTFLGAQAAIRAMRRHGGGGSIVNLSSTAGLVGYAMLASYNGSKGGVRLLSKSIAIECAAENIRCNSVHPGKIWTDMLEKSARVLSDPDVLKADVPLGYLGDPVDIANAILFLCSDEARYITGTELVIDGGLTAQ